MSSVTKASSGILPIPREIRDVLRQIAKLSFENNVEEIQNVALEALSRGNLTEEAKGVLRHRLAGELFKAKDVRGAKAQVLETIKLNLSPDLKTRILALRRKIDQADQKPAAPAPAPAPRKVRKIGRPPSISEAGSTPPRKKKRS